MTLTHQPLLDTPKGKFPSCKLISFIILSIATIGLVAFLTTNSNIYHIPYGPLSPSRVCVGAHDPSSCVVMLSEFTSQNSLPMDGVDFLKMFLRQSVPFIQDTVQITKDTSRRINEPSQQSAMTDCMQLMNISMDRVMDSISILDNPTQEAHLDAHTWLSSVLTNHFTCLEGLSGSARLMFEPDLEKLIGRARTSLALMVAVSLSPTVDEVNELVTGIFPAWVTARDRRLLETSGAEINANVVVAKDGSGKFKTVTEAIASAPEKSSSRYVIYIKKGIYKENVEIGSKKLNIMLTGDGMDSTIITGSLNVIDGSTTFKSATVAAVGDGFMAQDIWFQNTAGPQKHQAVALRVGADKSVINRCKIDAYQDTLYTHTNRQFYRDCYITGTVDFTFGNAAVVFQNCKIVARKGMSGQKNMVTAQGREDPNQNTGTSIQKCNVIASSDLEPVKGTMKSYLGRPWKLYSRTVFMQSYIADHIDASGWSIWDGDFALKTLYYGEYANTGPGAGTSNRVKWAGYRVITSATEANKFTVNGLIQGNVWLKSTGVTYTEGLRTMRRYKMQLLCSLCNNSI